MDGRDEPEESRSGLPRLRVGLGRRSRREKRSIHGGHERGEEDGGGGRRHAGSAAPSRWRVHPRDLPRPLHLPKSALPPRYKVDRAVSSAIYFLLPAGEIVKLHRIPCAETWHYYMGEPLTVFEVHDDGQIKMTVVGPDLRHGQRPQYTVPPNVWFGAFLTHDIDSFTEDGSVFVKTPGRDSPLHFSFVGVTCAPAFQIEDDEMATRESMKALAPKAEAFINYLVPSD